MKKNITTSNRLHDPLFQLIKSLGKAEKRNFKLFVGRNTASGDLKSVQLFDLLDKMTDYDEAALLKKGTSFKKEQLPNLKAHLYRQILASLRVLREEVNVEVQLHEQLEYARILYDKGLYQQSLRLLERTRETAKTYHQNSFWLQALVFEKKIESLHITRSTRQRAEEISQEVRLLNDRLALIGRLSNLSLQLYNWYIYQGHARNEQELRAVHEFFTAQLPVNAWQAEGFFERLYYAQAYCWYGFIAQDFLVYYRYARKWTELFDRFPQMRRVETAYYVKGMHNLLIAHFMLRNHAGFADTLNRFESFAESEEAKATDNMRAQTAIYLHIARLNGCFLSGDFTAGIALIPEVEACLTQFQLQTDRHRVLVFYYKIACVYFACGDYSHAIEYLHRIIHWKVDLRGDLQCYARLLHLISHYELGNMDIMEHLIKSVYRFMANMEHLSVVEEEIFRFIRKSFQWSSNAQIRTALGLLLDRLRRIEHDRFESRSFMYLDIISWIESKLEHVPVQEVIRRKREKDRRGGALGA